MRACLHVASKVREISFAVAVFRSQVKFVLDFVIFSNFWMLCFTHHFFHWMLLCECGLGIFPRSFWWYSQFICLFLFFYYIKWWDTTINFSLPTLLSIFFMINSLIIEIYLIGFSIFMKSYLCSDNSSVFVILAMD